MPSLQDVCAEALHRAPDRPVIEFEGHWRTWGELRQVAEGVQATWLALGLGILFVVVVGAILVWWLRSVKKRGA